MQLHGNKILITGATAGIGLALLHKFLELDNQVIAVGRNEHSLSALAQNDSRVIPFACDLSQTHEIDRLILFIEQQHADTNLLINNAGIQYNYLLADEPQLLGKMEHEISTNLLAPFKLTALLLPTLQSNPASAIVNVTSGLAFVPKKQASVYGATKAGLRLFTQALRYQLKQTRVFELIPSLVDTQMTTGRGKGKISPEQLVEAFIRSFEKDQLEIAVGKIKLLKLIHRLSPRLAGRIMNKGEQ